MIAGPRSGQVCARVRASRRVCVLMSGISTFHQTEYDGREYDGARSLTPAGRTAVRLAPVWT